MENYLPVITLGLLLLGTVLVYFVGRRSGELAALFSTLITFLTLILNLLIYLEFNQGKILELKIPIGLPFSLHFQTDALSIFLGLISAFLWFLAALYSLEYMKHRKTLFNAFLLFSLYGMLGIVWAGNMYTLLLFFEVFSVGAYVLVIHEGTPEAKRAGFQFLFMSIVGSVALIVATIVTYLAAGSVELTGKGLTLLVRSPYSTAIFWAYILGFGVKAGMFPVHVWLPEAHPIAPSSASALLSGIMIKAGAYGIIRTVYGLFGREALMNQPHLSQLLLVLAILTMILGSILAISQTELKRMLAYSSVAQIGYVILGVALLTPTALIGGALHIFNHALMKGALFLCAGSVISQTGLRNIKELEGIGKRLPLTMACFTLAALSMIGFPPFVGFLSKWLLGLGALEAAEKGIISETWSMIIIGSLVLSGLLNVVYYAPVITKAWFGPPLNAKVHSHQNHLGMEEKVGRAEPSWLMLVPMFVLSLGTLFFGLYSKYPLSLAQKVVKIYFP